MGLQKSAYFKDFLNFEMITLHQTPPCQLQPIYFRCVLFSSHLQFLLPLMNDDKYCDFFSSLLILQ